MTTSQPDKESWYQSISVPKDILDAIKELIAELRYWPSVTSFAREALLEKIRREKKVLKEVREARVEREGAPRRSQT